MNNIFNIDFQEFIESLNSCNVKYILVGGYSVILHGYSRTTGDMDMWIEPTKENFQKTISAFYKFGLPTSVISLEAFLDTDKYDVFSFGTPPVAIDIMTSVKGLEFNEAYNNSKWFNLEQELRVCVLSKEDLLKAKCPNTNEKYKYNQDLKTINLSNNQTLNLVLIGAAGCPSLGNA